MGPPNAAAGSRATPSTRSSPARPPRPRLRAGRARADRAAPAPRRAPPPDLPAPPRGGAAAPGARRRTPAPSAPCRAACRAGPRRRRAPSACFSWPCSGRAGYTNTGRTAPAMAETSELIDFRRAFVWLLCGMLLPSVALVAFGVVAVANERAAVERRLSEEYDARLTTLALDVMGRLDKAADAVSAGLADPLVAQVQPLETPPPAE